MDITRRTALLGGLAPRTFMRRHWQKAPLLVRQAITDLAELPDRDALFELAGRDGVDARLVVRGARWRVRQGPFAPGTLPSPSKAGWTVLVNAVDEHSDAARALLDRFRFIPDARVDDLMLSYATDSGGVGPHVDSYDVFLLQLHGTRHWRIGPVADPALEPGLPLKILATFEPTAEWRLEPGDMLYLPPGWGHDGIAEGECITASIGFRAPSRNALANELIERMLDAAEDDDDAAYDDPAQPATVEPARVPERLARFADAAIERLVGDAEARACALGEILSEPRPSAVFEPGRPPRRGTARLRNPVQLDRRTRMLYDDWHVFINGESFRAAGRDARLMRALADHRELVSAQVAALSDEARTLLDDWIAHGWVKLGHHGPPGD
ncbi:cupin domain-containing protein [Piscinibacter koreensis]|uniref:Cupin domain-containing protein n=1 Tax=Piscinibacter koreensis TaxID=2742824 RepID=A0A7Y6NKS2_9BURK|nr:cupin domain-containing protein [Schlegelella koreensis]NUZ05033.1 cupin domain-containing protein [Schlegelella koreensis]